MNFNIALSLTNEVFWMIGRLCGSPVKESLKGKCDGNLVSYQKLRPECFFFINRNLTLLLKFVVDCHPSVLRLSMCVSGHRWTGLQWTAT